MLTDLVDFRTTSFNKCLRTTGNVNVEYNSKYPSIKLNDMCLEITAGGDKPVVFSKEQTPKCKVPVFSNGVTNNGLFGYTDTPMIIQPCVTISARGTFGYCVFHDGPFVPIVRLIVCVPTSKYMPQYIKYIMEGIDVVNEGATTPQLSVPKVRQYKLPNAPIDVQKKIVSECSKAEEQYQKCIDNISRLKDDMDSVLADSYSKSTTDLRLDNEQVFNLSIGRRVLKSELKKDGAYEVFSANVFEPFGRIGSSLLTDFSKPSVLWGIDGDWMVNYLQADRPFYPTDHCGVIKVLDENVILPKYLVYPLLKAGEHERFSRANRASTERIKALTIRIPSINIQKNTVTKVIEIENEINTLKQKMKECKYQKQVILDKYLK